MLVRCRVCQASSRFPPRYWAWASIQRAWSSCWSVARERATGQFDLHPVVAGCLDVDELGAAPSPGPTSRRPTCANTCERPDRRVPIVRRPGNSPWPTSAVGDAATAYERRSARRRRPEGRHDVAGPLTGRWPSDCGTPVRGVARLRRGRISTRSWPACRCRRQRRGNGCVAA